MIEYVIPFIILGLIFLTGLIIFKALTQADNATHVDIIIDGECDEERLEQALISARAVSERYFPDSKIYINGGNEKLVSALCRAYGALRR